MVIDGFMISSREQRLQRKGKGRGATRPRRLAAGRFSGDNGGHWVEARASGRRRLRGGGGRWVQIITPASR